MLNTKLEQKIISDFQKLIQKQYYTQPKPLPPETLRARAKYLRNEKKKWTPRVTVI
jgi:predicted HAD superfamily Cof-like phosphohydrolase